MSFFQLGKRILNKKPSPAPDGAVPAEAPLNARIGSLLDMQRSDFVVLSSSLLVVPGATQQPIEAISRLHLDADENLRLFRFYTRRGKQARGDGSEFLQVMMDGNEATDVAYYQHLCRQTPQTREEQAPFKGEGFGLGELNFWLGEDLLEAAGIAQAKIDELLLAGNPLGFERDTPGATYVTPFTGRETRLDDEAGLTGLSQQFWMMPYTRTLPDGNTERLLIAFEVVDSVDGNPVQQVHVDYWAGLSIRPQKFQII